MITLNGTWQMNCKGEDSWQEGQVPGTVYTDLLRNGQMKDPYVGENEDEVRDLSYNDYTYRRTFKRSRHNLLRQLLHLLPGESRVITVEEVRSAKHIDVKTVEEELIVWSNYQIGRE